MLLAARDGRRVTLAADLRRGVPVGGVSEAELARAVPAPSPQGAIALEAKVMSNTPKTAVRAD
jgi:hypothetical protein